ncbi:MAG: hypothetical protein HGA98_06020, partial [Deltaproteobacteria bacterium]|nr:hypothetical protein [Deltaproteobacteria bacterium]
MRSCLYGDRFRWVDGRVAVAAEEPLEVRVDGVPRAVLLRTPGHEVELAVGFCVTEGLVGAASEIFSTGFGG